jgi:hypothetical protein
MQPLFQIATSFVGDAVSLVNGFGRIVTHLVMAPVERIARACDVAGILEGRAARAAERERLQRAWRSITRDAPRPHRPHRPRRHVRLFGCLRFLGELT